MTASKPGRRKFTAREVAERYGISERHVRRVIAEPRAEFLSRTHNRQLKAAELRDGGKSYAEIAAELDVTEVNARSLVHRGRKRRRQQEDAA